MCKARIFCVVFLLLGFSVLVFTQPIDEKKKEIQEKELVLLEEVLAEVQNFRLPENRAFIYAQIGDKIWKFDEKRARGFFQNSIDELIKIQREAEFENKNQQIYQNLHYRQDLRWRILNLLVNHDAEFALESLIKSRPAQIQTVLDKFPLNSENPYSNNYYTRFAQTEMQTEQRFAFLAARQNPVLTGELYRKSLKKNITYETLNLLQQIQQKDLDLANKLAEETVRELLKTNLSNGQILGLYYQFFNLFGNETNTENTRQIKISEVLLREMADKISTFWLSQNYQSDDVTSNAFKAVEKMFPTRAAEYKQRQEKRRIQTETQSPEFRKYNELMKKNPSAEMMIEESKKFTNYRSSLYDAALQKLLSEGKISELRNLLKNNFSNEEDKRRVIQFYSNIASNLISKGDFDEAFAVINEIPDEESRFSPIIQLANAVYYKNPKENKDQALAILRQANALVSNVPDNQIEINKLINLAQAYSIIEPAQGFQLIEMIINPINEFSKAYVVVSQFRNEGKVRQGEYIITQGTDATGHFNLAYVLQNLKNSDFDETVQLINRFDQFETRISFKLNLINSLTNLRIVELPINNRIPTAVFSNPTM